MNLEHDLILEFPHTALRSFSRALRKREEGMPQQATAPFREIDCTNIADDFYSNLIDWSGSSIYYSTNDYVFSYDLYSEKTQAIFQSSNSTVTSIKHCASKNTLCVGTASGLLNLIDLPSLKYSRYLNHRSRIGAMEIIHNQVITGSRDRKTKVIDLRTRCVAATFAAHTQEVCGLSVNNRQQCLASGGNDNKIFIYDIRKLETPLVGFSEHLAAVRALSWSPYSATQLVSGGGSADKTIKHWDISEKRQLISSHNFESQVCNLKWLKNNRIISTFGYSKDDVELLEDFKPVKVFSGHRNRVIHFAVNSTEKYFVSGSSESKIKVWEIESNDNDIKIR